MHRPEHVSGLACLSEDPLELLPLTLDDGVDGLNGSSLTYLEGQKEGVQKDAVAHQLRVTCRPAYPLSLLVACNPTTDDLRRMHLMPLG